MPLYSACSKQHTLVPVVADYYVCECPSVYRKQKKFFLDPQLKGLLDDILVAAGGVEGVRQRARALEAKEDAKREQRRAQSVRAKRPAA